MDNYLEFDVINSDNLKLNFILKNNEENINIKIVEKPYIWYNEISIKSKYIINILDKEYNNDNLFLYLKVNSKLDSNISLNFI